MVGGLAKLIGPKSTEPNETAHLWKATLPENLPEGYHVIEVETVDGFGQTFVGRRIIRVVAPL